MMTMVGLKQSLFRNIFHMKMILDTQIYCTFESMQFDIQFGKPFFKFFAGLYFFKNTFEFSILNGKKIQQYSSIVQYSIVQYSIVQYSIVQIEFGLNCTKGDQFQGMRFVRRASSAWHYEEKWNYRAIFLTEFKNI